MPYLDEIEQSQESLIFMQELFGDSNAITVIAKEPDGNHSQYLLVRRGPPDRPNPIGTGFDWCILVGEWELADLVRGAATMLDRFIDKKQCTVSGRPGEHFISLKVQDNAGNMKFYVDFPEQQPIAVSQGQPGRWRMYFKDVAEVRDFLNLVAQIDIQKGRVIGSTEEGAWPIPYRATERADYLKLASQLEENDTDGDYYYVTAVLKAIANRSY